MKSSVAWVVEGTLTEWFLLLLLYAQVPQPPLLAFDPVCTLRFGHVFHGIA